MCFGGDNKCEPNKSKSLQIEDIELNFFYNLKQNLPIKTPNISILVAGKIYKPTACQSKFLQQGNVLKTDQSLVLFIITTQPTFFH